MVNILTVVGNSQKSRGFIHEGVQIKESYKIVEEQQTPEGDTIPKHIERVQEYVANPPEPEKQPTLEERIINIEADTDMLTQCVLEMSELVYV